MVWYGMVWYGVVWYGMVWYGMGWLPWCWPEEAAQGTSTSYERMMGGAAAVLKSNQALTSSRVSTSTTLTCMRLKRRGESRGACVGEVG